MRIWLSEKARARIDPPLVAGQCVQHTVFLEATGVVEDHLFRSKNGRVYRIKWFCEGLPSVVDEGKVRKVTPLFILANL